MQQLFSLVQLAEVHVAEAQVVEVVGVGHGEISPNAGVVATIKMGSVRESSPFDLLCLYCGPSHFSCAYRPPIVIARI